MLALACASTAQAAMVEYSLTALGGNVWRYDYTLSNTGPAVSFDEFTVYFDQPGIAGITAAATPAGWSSIVVQPDPILPDAGFFDALSLAGSVPAGGVISGFSVAFSYLAGLTPGTQRFDLVTSEPFQTVFSGITSAAPSPVPLPVPAALLLVGLAAGAFGSHARPKTSSEKSGASA
ncbi:MAG: hypothetical protein H7Y33_16245 [Cytophagales bacterium]|nr:hypothetical protein [Rhizobacter sp.]